ncbi:probable G-protein coupled receptor CG31760 isoform X2 [Pomacea canaliculata]|uniref:probable G-protein coupled receptor CG31760 isoform X2 n=1 Tax=Pomacea canaliculata TaxID=400727 RepID=UPI000D72B41D|nr:probable G-protein coupled receptor CG31760 isoform X2 [Pomacea canaliculata]
MCQSSVRCLLVIHSFLFIFVCNAQSSGGTDTSDRIQEAKKALDYVQRIAQSSNCSSGTSNTLKLTFDTTAWTSYTNAAIRTANFLSQALVIGRGTLNSLNESILYDLVRNSVHGNTLVYGSAIALEPSLYSGLNTFCPYAHKTDQGFVVFDLAKSYNYGSNNTEWYHHLKIKNFSDVPLITDNVTYGSVSRQWSQPVANLSHGHWTSPYFDCGGGDIWMVTFSAPVLGLDSKNTPLFKGVSTIDLELTNIDINQCDHDNSNAIGSLDVFRGTHNCQPTTKCQPTKNQGFKRGSYTCVCIDGYYFPDTNNEKQAFEGSDIDKAFDDGANTSELLSRFQCLACPRGCDTCTDSTPCLYEFDPAIRILVVFLIAVLIVVCGVISFITFKYRKELVMKTASPIFLQMMLGGSVLMSMSVLIMFPEASDTVCTFFIWPFHLGFSVVYGALLIKTWRISVIFNSRKKVNLPDKVLLQRLAPLPALMTVYLVCWTVLGKPQAVTITMASSKKFFSCSLTYWNYAVYGVEVLLLLFGVYLCFTVRKAPAHFNESKHITWSTYNAIILGIFIITLTQMLERTAGPDVLYVLLMAQLQVFVTITLALIFVPKFWALYKGARFDQGQPGAVSVTGRVKAGSTLPTTSASVDVRHMGVQVTSEDLCLLPASSTHPVSQEENDKSTKPSLGLHSGKVSPSSGTAVKQCSTPQALLPRKLVQSTET